MAKKAKREIDPQEEERIRAFNNRWATRNAKEAADRAESQRTKDANTAAWMRQQRATGGGFMDAPLVDSSSGGVAPVVAPVMGPVSAAPAPIARRPAMLDSVANYQTGDMGGIGLAKRPLISAPAMDKYMADREAALQRQRESGILDGSTMDADQSIRDVNRMREEARAAGTLASAGIESGATTGVGPNGERGSFSAFASWSPEQMAGRAIDANRGSALLAKVAPSVAGGAGANPAMAGTPAPAGGVATGKAERPPLSDAIERFNELAAKEAIERGAMSAGRRESSMVTRVLGNNFSKVLGGNWNQSQNSPYNQALARSEAINGDRRTLPGLGSPAPRPRQGSALKDTEQRFYL